MKKRYKNPLKLLKRRLANFCHWNETFLFNFSLWYSLVNLNHKSVQDSDLEPDDLLFTLYETDNFLLMKPASLSLYLNVLILSEGSLFLVS